MRFPFRLRRAAPEEYFADTELAGPAVSPSAGHEQRGVAALADRAAANWIAHRTQRYHANARLAQRGQTLADHCHGVATLVDFLHPRASKTLILAALWHDVGEGFVGDIPWPAKQAYPLMAKHHAEVEKEAALRAAPRFDLTERERKWLKLADRLEWLLYASLYQDPLWSASVDAQKVYALARELGVEPIVKGIADRVAFHDMPQMPESDS